MPSLMHIKAPFVAMFVICLWWCSRLWLPLSGELSAEQAD